MKNFNNVIKIISLGLGLAVGLILISKVCFEQSYDRFYPEYDRIYQIQENISMEKGKMESFGQVSGGVAPGMRAEIPEVQAATRLTYIGDNEIFYTTDKRRLSGAFILADSCLFDILPRHMIVGNYKEVLARPLYALVSRSIAEKIGDFSDIVGQSFVMDAWPGRVLTIGGVFEDVPRNSHLKYDVVISLPSISSFMWDGTENWEGNDRYLAYVKLTTGVKPENLAPAFLKMQMRHMDMDDLRKAGVQLSYSLRPLDILHSGTPEAKRMSIILSLIAFALIFTATMNYILIVISSLVKRSKEIAVHKCYGADEKDITRRILRETLMNMILSLIVAFTLLFMFRGNVEELLAAPLNALFVTRTLMVLALVCVLVFLVAGIIPARIFSHIPVSSAIRNYKETRHRWRLWLLFIQFTATAFLVTLVVIIGRQYNLMVNDNPGYKYEKLLYCNTDGVKNEQRQVAVLELSRLSSVESVSTCSTIPIYGASGNNVMEIGKNQELFNIADLYNVDSEYLNIMEIPIIAGNGFTKDDTGSSLAVVSQSFAEKICKMLNWHNGVVGKGITVSEHGECTIVGVYSDIRIGSINSKNTRPSIMFYSAATSPFILIKLKNMSQDGIKHVTKVLESALPDKNIVVTPYKSSMTYLYTSSLLFRNSVLIGGIITLIISLIGLIGYTNDEVNRRRGEIAIRKVNGASVYEIQRLILINIFRIAIPALIIGGFVSAVTASKWMENFASKTSLSPLLFISCGILILAIIVSVVCIVSYRVAVQNPAKAIKNE